MVVRVRLLLTRLHHLRHSKTWHLHILRVLRFLVKKLRLTRRRLMITQPKVTLLRLSRMVLRFLVLVTLAHWRPSLLWKVNLSFSRSSQTSILLTLKLIFQQTHKKALISLLTLFARLSLLTAALTLKTSKLLNVLKLSAASVSA